ncbi:MAG: ATP-binding protein [Synechococcales bacterium]|nr:ATP-binding protein [Synechococcales bacterium]
MNTITLSPPSTESSKLVRILIVEDEYIIAANLRENLESLGYDILDIAISAEEAMSKATELCPDLVLMDIRLQGEADGIYAAEQIWGQLAIPVIYLTGHSDKSTLERAKVTFPFGYLLKPVREKELYVAIETALNRYERERFLNTVLQTIGDGIIIFDIQCRIKYLNLAAEIMTGWRCREAKDQDVAMVLKLIDENTQKPIQNPMSFVFKKHSTVYLNQEILLVNRHGKTLPVTDSIAPLRDNDGNVTGAVLVLRDDTQRRLREQHNLAVERAQILELQMRERERLNQLKDDFLSSVCHEMRTPLASIKVAVQMLELTLNQLDVLNSNKSALTDRIEIYLRVLNEECNVELGMVNDLLQIQQIDAENHPFQPTSIDLKDWLLHVIETFQKRVEQRQQHLQLICPPNLPNLVTDLSILTRIFTELLTNACKYTPPEERIIVSVEVVDSRVISSEIMEAIGEASLLAGETPQPGSLRLMVTNTGVELPKEELTRIFDKFYRIPSSDRWKQGGTGLGLALIKKLTAYLGGSIWAESHTQQVSFIVELPLHPSEGPVPLLLPPQ